MNRGNDLDLNRHDCKAPLLPGRSTSASSWVPHGGKARPAGAGVRPVQFATAAISMADFVPSRNEFEHSRVHPAGARLFRRQTVMAPDRVGRGGMVCRQVISCPCRRRWTVNPAGARPNRPSRRSARADRHTPGSRRRRPFRLAREQRARQNVGLDIDHDDVLCPPGWRVAHGRFRRGRARGFHDDLHVRIGEHRHGVGGEARGGDAILGPADGAAGARARSGDRSAIAATSNPAVVGTCDRNMEPIFRRRSGRRETGRPAARSFL